MATWKNLENLENLRNLGHEKRPPLSFIGLISPFVIGVKYGAHICAAESFEEPVSYPPFHFINLPSMEEAATEFPEEWERGKG